MRSPLASKRDRFAGAVMLCALLFVIPLSHAQPTPENAFSGVVSDTVGNLLQNVELLIVDSGVTPEPLASTRSDERGRFRFAEFPGGVYRLAALKQGYVTFVGRVDTQAQRWLQVVMHPTAGLPASMHRSLPDDSSWVYRLPRRYVLHERGREPQGERSTEPAPTTSESGEPLSMQLDQMFSMPAESIGNQNGRSEVRGTETQVKLASPIGGRGAVDVQGFHRQIGSTRHGENETEANRDAAVMSLAFAYDTGPEDRVAFNAFYSQSELGYSLRAPTGAAGGDRVERREREHRRWGYDATWSTQLDPASSLRVRLDYFDTTLDGTQHVPTLGPDPPALPSNSVSARTVGATGVYAHSPLEDHEVQIDFSAQRLDSSRAEPYAGQELAVPLDLALSGWNVGLEAHDTWSISRPVSLTYGLGYRHVIGPREAALVVPRVGAGLVIERISIRGSMAYHGVEDLTSNELAAAFRTIRPEQPWGYEASIDLPLGERVSLAGTTAFSPVQFDPLGYARGEFADLTRPIFVTDGNASLREQRVALIQRSRRARTYFEYASGLAEGLLAPITLSTAPTGFLVESRLEYGTGRFGIHISHSGTDVMLEYQTLGCSPTRPSVTGDTREESLELRVTQPLLQGLPIGDWRLLMAVRRATLTGLVTDAASPTEDTSVLDALNHQLSAGLSVSF